MRPLVFLVFALASAACGGSAPTAPSTAPTTSPSFNTSPDFAGAWTASYTVATCTATAAMNDAGFCSQAQSGPASVSFVLTQSNRNVTGTFQLGSLEFPSVTGTIAADGALTLSATRSDLLSIEASWTLKQTVGGVIVGQTRQVWRSAGVSGEGTLDGQFSGATRRTSLSSALTP